MNKTTAALTVIGAVLLLAGPAFSEDADYVRKGYYLGASAVGGYYSRYDHEVERQLQVLGYTVHATQDTTAGFKLYGGYRVGAPFAIEAQFEMLPNGDVDQKVAGSLADLKTWFLSVNGKVFILPPSRFQPFVLAGFGNMEARVDRTYGPNIDKTHDGFASRFGVGIDIYITEHIVSSTGADYILPTGNVEYLDYISFGTGLQYRF